MFAWLKIDRKYKPRDQWYKQSNSPLTDVILKKNICFAIKLRSGKANDFGEE